MRNFSGNETYLEFSQALILSKCQWLFILVAAMRFSLGGWEQTGFALDALPWSAAVLRCRVSRTWGPDGLYSYFRAGRWTFRWQQLRYRLSWNQTYKTITDKHLEKAISIHIF